MSEYKTEIGAAETSRGYSALEYHNLSFWFLWAGIVLVYVILRINTVNIPLERDEGMFGYMGQLILDGGLPYRDAFDHKPPVVFYLNALALILVPPTPFGIHLFLHIYNFLTLLTLYFLGKTYSNSPTPGMWVALIYAVFSSSPGIEGYAATTEMFLLLPLTLSLLFAVLAVRKSKYYFSILSGLFAALAFWTKHTAALIILFIILYLIVAQIKNDKNNNYDFSKVVKSSLLWCSGFFLISLLIALYFFSLNSFDQFIYCNFTYNFVYSKGLKFTKILPSYLRVTKKIFSGNFFVIALGIGVGFVHIVRKDKTGVFMLGFLFFSLLATIPGYAYWHYFAQLAAAIALAGGLGLTSMLARLGNKKTRAACSLLCAAAILLIPVFVHSDYYYKEPPDQISRHYFGINPFPESIELAGFLAARTWRKDSIFIFGSEPQLLLYAQRKSAAYFAYVYPLMSEYPGYKEFQRQVWDDITKAQPRYIITVELPTSLGWDGKADLWLVMKMRQLMESNYYLEAVMTIEKPKGKLLILSEMDNPKDVLKDRRIRIYILRSKSSGSL